MKVTVKQIYDYCKAHNIKMLSNYTSTFWNEYKSNSTRYDFLFMRLFKSFKYIETDFETLDDAVEDFISSVYAHLLVNDKKYSELYRINVLDDSTYSMLDNYNLTETMTKQDSSNVMLLVGEQTDSSSQSVSARTDNTSQSVGARTDTTSQSVGARTDQLTMVRDTHTDTLTADIDEVRTKQLNGVSPFDRATPDSGVGGVSVGGMYDATSSDTQTNPRTDITTQEYGRHTDTDSNVIGAQTTTGNNVVGEQTVTGSNVIGAQTVTGSVTNGSRADHTTGNSSENYTLTRVGNIGIQTPTDILDKHRTFWSAYEFYEYIFQQLSYDYLEIGG